MKSPSVQSTRIDSLLKTLLKKNLTFVHNAKLAKIRENLRNGQHPDVVVVCCSDSRVPPEVIFTLGNTLGRLFVVRNAGAIVDEVALESIMYALEKCNTRLVVVLGHEGCGAVGAACSLYKTRFPELVRRIRVFFNGTKPSPDEAVKLSTVGTAACIRRHLKKNADVLVVSAIYCLNGNVKIMPKEIHG